MTAHKPEPQRPGPERGTAPNTTRAQRARILARLQAGECDGATLGAECWVPSPTKRISELRLEGWPIVTRWTLRRGPDGTVSELALYSLPESDPRQLSLPLSP